MNPRERERVCEEAAAALESGRFCGGVYAGFDGFVDRLTDVVDSRRSADSYERVGTIGALADRVRGAAGRSANLELVTTREQMGGNGALLAKAAGTLGLDTIFVGTVGAGGVMDVFEPLRRVCAQVRSVAAPGQTDALEFDDGKLLLGRPASLNAVTWEAVVLAAGGAAAWRESLGGRLLAMGNWTMTPGMTAIWRALARDVLPGSGCAGVFLDLADPAKRTDEDLCGALGAMREMGAQVPVTLGLNVAEAARVARVLGVEGPPGGGAVSPDELVGVARRVQETAGLGSVAVHTHRGAALADAGGSESFGGPFTARPVFSTGAGDHFNAGLCAGLLLEVSRGARLALGAGCGGWLVRRGASPTAGELAGFLRALPVEAE